MPKIETPMKLVQEDYQCDRCNNGVMRPTSISLMCNPPVFPHKCTECEHTQNFRERYPTIKYIPIEGAK